MLKIKDNVKFKVLEKYGFEIDYGGAYTFDCGDNRTYLVIDADNSLFMSNYYGDLPADIYEKQLTILYDLIVDGLVEKVDD